MQNPSRPSLSRLVLALGLGLAGATSAHAADIASATASISSLRYRLIDLDLNDGITPTLSVGGGLSVSGFTSVKNADGFVEQNPLDQNNIASTPWFSSGVITWASAAPGASATLGGGMVSTSVKVNSDSLLANARLESNTTNSQIQTYDNDGILRYATVTETINRQSTSAQQYVEAMSELPNLDVTDEFGNVYPTPQPNITLSANTLLLVEGTLTLAVNASSQAFSSAISSVLSPLALANGNHQGHLSAFAGVGFDPVSTYQVLPGGSTLEQGQPTYTALNQALSFDTYRVSQDWAPYDPDAAPKTELNGGDARAFALTFANTGTVDLQGFLSVRVNVDAYVTSDAYQQDTTLTFGDPVPDTPVLPPVPGIPEPSTYALMGLGLVGIVLARRRLRPTHAA
jgi:PEP-CTERM motif